METSLAIHIISLASIFVCEASSINTPPDISFVKEWILTEDEPIGSTVARIQVKDADNDKVTISIGKPSSKTFPGRPDASSFFKIDDSNRVKLIKSLQGMAGEVFLVGIIASDGHLPNRIDAKVVIKPKGAIKWTSSSMPEIPPYSSGTSPPLLHLDPYTTWKVPSNAKIGSFVATVEADDLSNTFLKFSIQPNTLLNIDATTGKVTVAKPLIDKIGDHKAKVKVENRFQPISEEITLKVTPPGDLISNVTSTPSSTSLTDTVDGSTPIINQTDKGLPEGVKSSTGSETTLGWGVVMLVLIFGVIPLVMVGIFLLWRWRRKNKLRTTAKESSVSYSEKRRSISHVESGHRESIIEGLFTMVGIHKRAESNGYEEDIKAPKVPNRESKKSTKSSKSLNSNEENDSWEFSRHKLRILGILGEGCFGQVWKCEAIDLDEKGPTLVAVKTLKESAGAAEQRDLLQELKVLKSLGHHPNVVSLIGCCTEKEPIFVILEYMIGGKLQSYLRSSRAGHSYGNLHGTSASLTPRDLTIFALQVARGMDFLSKNGIIHRDLAARNILIGENKVCKVADFGFARDVANNHVYERKSDGRLPIRWMAPESLFDNIFTSKSDVWSFGILLWEIVTLGSTPYPGMSAADVMRKVKDGYRLEKPDHCRREIYNIMYYCWDSDQLQRPSFPELVETLESLIMTEVEYIHLDNFPDHSYYNFSSVSTSGELL